MTTTLNTEFTVKGTECTTQDGQHIATITYHGAGLYELWRGKDIPPERWLMPFLWYGLEAAEFAALAAASDHLKYRGMAE